MKTFFIFLAFFFVNDISSQLTPADSLQSAFKKASTDTAKLSVLFKDTPLKYLGKSDLMLDLYQQGYAMARQLNDKNKIYKAQYYTALIYIYDKSDEGTAFQWLLKALIAAEVEQNNRSIQHVYYAMGVVHHHQGNRDDMYKAFYKSAAYAENVSDPNLSDGAFGALSQNLYEDKRWQDYLDINKRWVALMEKVNAPPANKLIAYNSLFDALIKFSDKKKERDYYFAKTNALLDKIPDLGESPDMLMIAASIYYKFNRQKEAIMYANKILNLKNNDGLTLSNKGLAHELLADVYENQKNYPLSNIHLKAYQKFEIEQMQQRLTEDAGRKVIKAEADRNLLLKQKEVDKQKWVSILGFSIAFLVLMGGLLAYRFYKQEQKRQQELTIINATKDKLFSIIAHDLRTPIGTLKTHLEMTDFGLLSQADFANASQKLTNNVNALFQTLDNLLQWAYSQLKGIKAKPENLNLYEVVSEELQFLNATAQRKKIAIINNIAPETTAFADKNQIGLVIRNTVSNALKFTNAGGEIVLKSFDTNGGKMNLTISDNGIGMPQSIQNQLFTINEKVSRRGTAQEKGQGLGLILAKEMMEANKGSLKIESVENKGTTVHLELPS